MENHHLYIHLFREFSHMKFMVDLSSSLLVSLPEGKIIEELQDGNIGNRPHWLIPVF